MELPVTMEVIMIVAFFVSTQNKFLVSGSYATLPTLSEVMILLMWPFLVSSSNMSIFLLSLLETEKYIVSAPP